MRLPHYTVGMKTILLISRCPPYPLHFGDRLIVWHLARQLAQRGYTIDLLAYAQRSQDWQEQAEYAAFFRDVQLVEEPRRSQWAYLKRLLLPRLRFPVKANQAWSPQMWQAVESRVQQRPYDVVHLFGGVQVYEFWHAVQKVPALITPYESYSLYLKRELMQSPNVMTQINQRVAAAYERFMFTPYARTVVLAEPDRAELLRLNPSLAVEVIPNGIDLGAFKAERSHRDAATLLFVGNYEYGPNVDAALYLAREIFPQVQQVVPDARLQLIGNEPPPALKALASEQIMVPGRVPDVQPYLAQATAFVCPLRIGAGIKNKVLEALAMGTPLVASPIAVDGIDVVDGQSALVAAPDQMAAAVIRLLRDAALGQRLAQQGQALIAAHYTWEAVADRYEALYDQLQR
ncbi:glycosyltransferase family 4 protein [Phototrophicus methaneseepsis]|nr:glycosyltransferase family 4 protein [Phototrophicus methaneseepsis]